MSVRSKRLSVLDPREARPLEVALVSRNAATSALTDSFERVIRYLRISVTDRCNYRCQYCMPEGIADAMKFAPRAALLSFEEVERVARVFAGLGVRKIRLTGGEPTIRAGLSELVARLRRLDGIHEVVMTSNGHLLGEMAAPLAAAGLTGVHISIDSLDPVRFANITGRGDLAKVKDGIAAAREAGILRGLNTVAMAGTNDDEFAALCAFAWDHDAIPRFIEPMPMANAELYQVSQAVTAAAIRERLAAGFGPLTPVAAEATENGQLAGPARYWQTRTGKRIGFISAMSDHFCGDCNRLRLTASGQLHACLGYDDATDLRAVLRAGGSDDALCAAIGHALARKRFGHGFTDPAVGGPKKAMVSVGG